MSKLFGVDIAGILHQNLSGGLLTGTLTAEVTTARDPDDPTAGPTHADPDTYSFKGIVEAYADKEIDGVLVLKEDRRVLMTAKSIKPAVIPAPGMKVSIAGLNGLWRIERVKSDPATATYVCQARK